MAEVFDWDHLRVFLAVMRAPSLRQAADVLGISHPTIRRRIDALEAHLGLRLFDRRSDGLHATPEAAEICEMAETIEASVLALGRRAMDADLELRGPIRVTAPDVLASDLLMPDILAFMERWPQIEVHLETSYELADLGSREADVAIRAVRHGRSPEGDVAGRRAGTSYAAIYGKEHQWIGWSGDSADREWVSETPYADLPIRGGFNSPTLQRQACAAGLGLTRLPCFYADGRLERRTEPAPHFDIWVLVHPDMRRNPRLRLFRDAMVDALKRLRPRLEGRAAAPDEDLAFPTDTRVALHRPPAGTERD